MTPSERNRLKRQIARVSSARNSRHGPAPADAFAWWQQIEEIARDLGLAITFEDWHAVSERRHVEQQHELL